VIVKILTAVMLICVAAGLDMAQSGSTARDNRTKDLLERQLPGLRWGVTLFVSGQSPHPASFSVHCKDVTLKGALNAIARAQGFAVWDYVETHCDGKDEVVIRF
jgi:hypothetical protein